MGIFADFRAQSSYDLTPPVEGSARVFSNDIDRLEAHFGDVDYPAGVTNPALAILQVSGVLIASVDPIEFIYNRGNNANLPKEATMRALAAEAAIINDDADLEDVILGGIKYPPSVHQAQTPPTPVIVQPGTDPGLPVNSWLFNSQLPVATGGTYTADQGAVDMDVYLGSSVPAGTGKVGGSAHFNGSLMAAMNTGVVSNTGPWHICFWYKPNEIPGAGAYPSLVSQGDSGYPAWAFAVAHYGGALNELQVRVWDNGGIGWPNIDPNFNPVVGEWCWLDLYYSATEMGFAVNNAAATTRTIAPSLWTNANDDFIIGQQTFNHEIDGVMVFDKKLSQDERDFIYNNGLGWEHS